MDYDKLINDIVWWIPFKNKRNTLRNELIKLITDRENYLIYQKDKEIFNSIDKIIDLTNEQIDSNKQKEILKENLKLIEIETHSFCNRKCWFCPNSIIDRHSNNIELHEELYLKIINNLKEIDFSNTINFHRFNEPLSHKELILKRINQARIHLPNARLGILTNADYLNKEYLEELENSGINYILMSYYFEKDEQFDKERIINVGMKKLMDKLGLNIEEKIIDTDKMLQVKLCYKNIDIIYKASDFKKMGNSRGGLIKDVNLVQNRFFRCFYPFTDLHIDYNGNVMPCCNLRSDIKGHESFILGNIANNSLFEIFTNKKSSNIRKYLSYNSVKQYPCNECCYESEWKFRSII